MVKTGLAYGFMVKSEQHALVLLFSLLSKNGFVANLVRIYGRKEHCDTKFPKESMRYFKTGIISASKLHLSSPQSIYE